MNLILRGCRQNYNNWTLIVFDFFFRFFHVYTTNKLVRTCRYWNACKPVVSNASERVYVAVLRFLGLSHIIASHMSNRNSGLTTGQFNMLKFSNTFATDPWYTRYIQAYTSHRPLLILWVTQRHCICWASQTPTTRQRYHTAFQPPQSVLILCYISAYRHNAIRMFDNHFGYNLKETQLLYSDTPNS